MTVQNSTLKILSNNRASVNQDDVTELFTHLKSRFEAYLKTFIEEALQESILPVNEDQSKDKNETGYITAKEVCSFLNISKPTLWRWVEKGTITKHYFNGIPRYSLAEIKSLSKSIEPKN